MGYYYSSLRDGLVSGHWLTTHLPAGPLARQVDAEAGDDGGLVLQAHGGEVEAVAGHEVRGLRQVLASCHDEWGRERRRRRR